MCLQRPLETPSPHHTFSARALLIFSLVKRKRVRANVRSIVMIAVVCLLTFALSACGSTTTVKPSATPERSPDLILTLAANRFEKPVTLARNSSQVDKGAIINWLMCNPCHGDVGQGLTAEYRANWPPEDRNCWQSKCHAANHPPDGFQFPQTVPALIGPTALTRYATAAELQQVIATRMPWYNPRLLSAEDDWDVTAYLLRTNGVLPTAIVLDEGNAQIVRVHVPPPATTEERPITIGVVGFLLVAVIAIVYRGTRRS